MTWQNLADKYPTGGKWGNSDELARSYIPQAESELNGYLAQNYTVPFSPVPPLINDLCVDLVYYKLAIVKEPKQAEAIKKYFDARIAELQAGTLTLVSSGTTLESQANWASISADHHSVFGPDSPTNWQPDTDGLQDAEDARLSD